MVHFNVSIIWLPILISCLGLVWSYSHPKLRVSNGLGRAARPGGVRPMAQPGVGHWAHWLVNGPGRALDISKARGPARGPSSWPGGRAGVKIKIIFSFEGNSNPFPYGSIRELATNWADPLLCNYFALVIYILEMLSDFWKKIKVSWLFNGHMTVEHATHNSISNIWPLNGLEI